MRAREAPVLLLRAVQLSAPLHHHAAWLLALCHNASPKPAPSIGVHWLTPILTTHTQLYPRLPTHSSTEDPDSPPPERDANGGRADPGFSGMEIEFLGTSSGQPTLWRNVSGIGLRFPAENWLFDCGEGTQHRLMVSSLAYPRITRIFVTHTHGDHIFGLPGVIASISGARKRGGWPALLCFMC